MNIDQIKQRVYDELSVNYTHSPYVMISKLQNIFDEQHNFDDLMNNYLFNFYHYALSEKIYDYQHYIYLITNLKLKLAFFVTEDEKIMFDSCDYEFTKFYIKKKGRWNLLVLRQLKDKDYHVAVLEITGQDAVKELEDKFNNTYIK